MSKLRIFFVVSLVILGVLLASTVFRPMATGEEYSQVPETAEFYARVDIYFGEPERVLLRVAINPDTGKVAHIEDHALKTLPSR